MKLQPFLSKDGKPPTMEEELHRLDVKVHKMAIYIERQKDFIKALGIRVEKLEKLVNK